LISVIITASDDGEALARLLTALVPAAAEGLVREVAVVGATGLAAEVAEDAGADAYETFALAFERARGPWVAGLPLAATFSSDWMAEIADHMRRAPNEPARLTARGFSLRAPEGWLAPKRLAPSALVVEQDLQALARRGRRLRILDLAGGMQRNRRGDGRRGRH
jgi:hypothetical protein